MGSNISGDDIAAIVAYDGKIGVVWSNQNTGAFYWAVHRDSDADTAWQPVQTIAQGNHFSDDHLSVVSLGNDPAGKVAIAAKTSLGDVSSSRLSDPTVVVFILRNDGTWAQITFGTIADDHTRPIIVADLQARNLYVFATAPVVGGTIYYKAASLSTLSFPPGLGTPIIASNVDPRVNDVTSTRQPVNSSTGLVVLAADDTTNYYLHNYVIP
jgi:hypothetical protein